jgi:ParB-like nuclease domain
MSRRTNERRRGGDGMVPFAVAPSSDRIEQLPIECIVVGERVRRFSEQTISALVASIEVNGLVNPITTWRPNRCTVPHLIAGAHRLEAAKRLGWKLIPCLVVAPDDHDRAALIEIDENLARVSCRPPSAPSTSTSASHFTNGFTPRPSTGVRPARRAAARKREIQSLDVSPTTPPKRQDAQGRLSLWMPPAPRRSPRSPRSSTPRSTRARSLMRSLGCRRSGSS